MRVYATFKNILRRVRMLPGKTKRKTNFEIFGFGVWFTQEVGQMDVQKRWNMTGVEKTDMSQVNRFFEQH